MNPDELLTVAECTEIDQTLLPAQDRFAIRITVYSLRYLTPVAEQRGIELEELQSGDIYTWIESDRQLQTEELNRPGFMVWYAQFLISSLEKLGDIAKTHQVAIQELTIDQIISWFQERVNQSLKSSHPEGSENLPN